MPQSHQRDEQQQSVTKDGEKNGGRVTGPPSLFNSHATAHPGVIVTSVPSGKWRIVADGGPEELLTAMEGSSGSPPMDSGAVLNVAYDRAELVLDSDRRNDGEGMNDDGGVTVVVVVAGGICTGGIDVESASAAGGELGGSSSGDSLNVTTCSGTYSAARGERDSSGRITARLDGGSARDGGTLEPGASKSGGG